SRPGSERRCPRCARWWPGPPHEARSRRGPARGGALVGARGAGGAARLGAQGRFMQRILSGFDWEACSRVEEDATGMRGVALVLRRHTEDTTLARVEAAVAVDDDDELLRTLIAWGVGLSRAVGAQVVQVWRVWGIAVGLV